MISFFFFFFFLCLSSMPYMVIYLVLLSFMFFISLWSFSGSSWFFLVFCLLFIGGILVVFMIVSSLYPNKNSFSPSFSKKLLFFIPCIYMGIFLLYFCEDIMSFKSFFFFGYNFFLLFFLVIFYFFFFIYILSSDKISLRTLF